jgi:hypothetical protein
MTAFFAVIFQKQDIEWERISDLYLGCISLEADIFTLLFERYVFGLFANTL